MPAILLNTCVVHGTSLTTVELLVMTHAQPSLHSAKTVLNSHQVAVLADVGQDWYQCRLLLQTDEDSDEPCAVDRGL